MSSWVVVVQALPESLLQVQMWPSHTEHEACVCLLEYADLGAKLIGGMDCFSYSHQSKQQWAICSAPWFQPIYSVAAHYSEQNPELCRLVRGCRGKPWPSVLRRPEWGLER